VILAAAALITLQSLLDHAKTHVHIPETTPVQIQVSDRSPMDTQHATNLPIAWVEYKSWGYLISVRRSTLKRSLKQQEWTVFHELCHVVYDYDYIANWSALSPGAKQEREDRANTCASELFARHEKECK
jgi:IrrE N-terminal-like domain